VRICGTCGTPATSPWAKFCVKCGATLPAPEPAPAATPAYAFTPYVVRERRNAGVAVAGMIFGIAAFVMYFVGIVLAPVAIVCGIIGRHKVEDDPAAFKGRGMATAGVVLGFTFMVLATAIVSALVFARIAQLR
jgi:hypothetical protein